MKKTESHNAKDFKRFIDNNPNASIEDIFQTAHIILMGEPMSKETSKSIDNFLVDVTLSANKKFAKELGLNRVYNKCCRLEKEYC